MPKTKNIYICQSCGFESPQWLGQCPSCKNWNTFEETIVAAPTKASARLGGLRRAGGYSAKPISLSQVKNKETERTSSGSDEFDRVLGGGFVSGQAVLLAGDPGIGKSTLLTQIAKNMPKNKILYVCGEESLAQVKVRAERMGYKAENLLVIAETDADVIADTIEQTVGISLVIVDAIQSITSDEYTGFAGSIGQVRAGTQKLTNMAKKTGVPVILVGHVTKEGTVAGPKVLEHIVDTVLYLEGDSQHLFRVLKTTKNRFGPISEAGIFEMQEAGMREVENPSELFLSQKVEAAVGSCVTVVMEGFRPILFEIQALTLITKFGNPRRTASGFSVNRLQVLLAIIEKSLNLNLSSYDVYLNVAGGLKVNEYAADLAVCLAVISSVKNKPLPSNVAAFGECGLLGEIRGVSYQQKREKEAQKLGYAKVINPQNSKTLGQAISQVFSRKT